MIDAQRVRRAAVRARGAYVLWKTRWLAALHGTPGPNAGLANRYVRLMLRAKARAERLWRLAQALP